MDIAVVVLRGKVGTWATGSRRMMGRLLLEASAAGALSRTIETTESKK
jgi:hypothetical protein